MALVLADCDPFNSMRAKVFLFDRGEERTLDQTMSFLFFYLLGKNCLAIYLRFRLPELLGWPTPGQDRLDPSL